MNILITILLVLAAVIVLLLLLALFTNKTYSLKREIRIGKPVQEVFHFLRYLRNQEHFSKWVMMDPNMKKEFRGTDGSVGYMHGTATNRLAKVSKNLKASAKGKESMSKSALSSPLKELPKHPLQQSPFRQMKHW